MILKKFSTSSCDCSQGCECATSQDASTSCPACKELGKRVSALTIKSQLKKETLEYYASHIDSFNFCNNPKCKFVYYDESKSILITQNEIKSKVTIKNDDPTTPLCYCQKLLKKDFFAMLEAGEQNISTKLQEIIASGKSFCEKSNPKGVCCTEDVKAFVASHGLVWENSSASSGCC